LEESDQLARILNVGSVALAVKPSLSGSQQAGFAGPQCADTALIAGT
jgi:hypothetical protein